MFINSSINSFIFATYSMRSVHWKTHLYDFLTFLYFLQVDTWTLSQTIFSVFLYKKHPGRQRYCLPLEQRAGKLTDCYLFSLNSGILSCRIAHFSVTVMQSPTPDSHRIIPVKEKNDTLQPKKKKNGRITLTL